MTIKLYCFGESGHSYKAALTLNMMGLDWDAIKVDFFAGETRSETYRSQVNTGRSARSGGRRCQIDPIRCDPTIFGRKNGQIRRQNQRGRARGVALDFVGQPQTFLDGGHDAVLNELLAPEKQPAETIAFNQGRLKSAYQILDAHLAGRDWVVGDDVTIVDMTCCGYLLPRTLWI